MRKRKRTARGEKAAGSTSPSPAARSRRRRRASSPRSRGPRPARLPRRAAPPREEGDGEDRIATVRAAPVGGPAIAPGTRPCRGAPPRRRRSRPSSTRDARSSPRAGRTPRARRARRPRRARRRRRGHEEENREDDRDRDRRRELSLQRQDVLRAVAAIRTPGAASSRAELRLSLARRSLVAALLGTAGCRKRPARALIPPLLPPLPRRPSLGDHAAVAALALLEVEDRLEEVALAEVRPEVGVTQISL